MSEPALRCILLAPASWRGPGGLMTDLSRFASTRGFQSCLLASQAGWETQVLVRGLHDAGYAVLERPAIQTTLALAVSAEFDVILWACDGSPDEAPVLARLALAPAPLLAVLAAPLPAVLALCLESGADACITLDADARVVAAQVSAVLRRRNPLGAIPDLPGRYVRVGDLTVDSEHARSSAAERSFR